jgi:predicted nucleic acid-binding Zn ribbon protein
MNCDRATRLMSESQDRPLTPTERTTLRMHTWICEGCRNFKGQVGFIRQAMKSFAQRQGDERSPDDED